MHEGVAAYVLGVLDDEEIEEFERHLDTCARCQAELQDMAEIPGRLDELKDLPAASEDDPPMSMSR
ncbi:zf-HC2 domain-containing protein [Nonomuraea sp. NEAU-A123]|jgi:anti-sigma factor RsiW|nr:zf-HC2 domain-containing protein [Nonomuraea sp. NEAU-A123]